MLLSIGALFIFVSAIPYIIYVFGIYFGKHSGPPLKLGEYPNLSIIMSAFNEERVIDERIRNIFASTYPIDRIEIILVNDCSTDRTGIKAQEVCQELQIPHLILPNNKRIGTNRSYNRALKYANHDIIVTTDANKCFKEDALEFVIARLLSDSSIAAVCGDQRPSSSSSSSSETGALEEQYRNVYGQMCYWESSVDSTYNFNGPLVAFKRNIIDNIEERKGADDANTAFEAIRKGYRAFYEIRAVVYEEIPKNFHDQYHQKIRRATRLVESTLLNLDLLKKNRPFSRFFYPLRIFMIIGTPIFLSIGSVFLLVWLFVQNYLLAFILSIFILLFLKYGKKNLFSAFIFNQIYLLIGLCNLGKDMRIWDSTS